MSTDQVGAIAGIVVAILGVATASGGLIKLLVDGLKATGIVPDGWAGGVAVLISFAVGVAIGVVYAVQNGHWIAVVITAIGGLAAGAVAIGAHMAVTPNEPAPAVPNIAPIVAPVVPVPPAQPDASGSPSMAVTFRPDATGPTTAAPKAGLDV